jgi:glyoxylase-like metal-dependent hydrolase (beta-lactamase superfamily II)
MIEEVQADIYKLEIPLPNNPLRAINSYVIKNSERNLMIDTGWKQDECIHALQAGLRSLGVDLRETDFFITHLHADHLGLVSTLATETSKIFFNQPDADRIHSGIALEDLIPFARLNGFPEGELQTILHTHPGFRYRSDEHIAFHTLKEGDPLSCGGYFFLCVETPGHTWGHMCLYEAHKKILVSGDHILADITPNIQLWDDKWDPLKEYLASLDKVYQFDIELVLPGHRRVFRNCRDRIRELKDHHQRRLDEIISILKKGSKNAFQVGSQMSWDITYDSWDLFPVTQKWFAVGEAISHLKYLEGSGLVRKEGMGNNWVFSLV